ncbi:terminase small subunit [Fusobacterium polymorphum]|jgi:phage terminase, small subunit|uniref:terminase small subunit n=1 Tax=Fusobacterium nucleatum subsp. polymorphum TaxID=76857 RepID=UPI002B4C160B|nr:terminase small subunit [Fusobacterium polymorphum]WRL77622.1 terminase small subunit [Fusobacterium polymorphum]
MTHRQELFIQEYIKTGNTTNSAIKAGYSKRTAKSIGQRLLTFVNIKKRIEELSQKIANNNNIMTAKERQEYLTKLINSDDVKVSDKLKALDILNKMTGEYTQKVEVNGEIKTDPFKDLTTEELKKIIFDN